MDGAAKKTRTAQEIKKTVLELIQDIREGIADSSIQRYSADVAAAYFKSRTEHTVASAVVEYILPEQSSIKSRQEEFVKEGLAKILAKMLDQDPSAINSLLGIEQRELDDDQKRVIWLYMDTLIGLALAYKKIS